MATSGTGTGLSDQFPTRPEIHLKPDNKNLSKDALHSFLSYTAQGFNDVNVLGTENALNFSPPIQALTYIGAV